MFPVTVIFYSTPPTRGRRGGSKSCLIMYCLDTRHPPLLASKRPFLAKNPPFPPFGQVGIELFLALKKALFKAFSTLYPPLLYHIFNFSLKAEFLRNPAVRMAPHLDVSDFPSARDYNKVWQRGSPHYVVKRLPPTAISKKALVFPCTWESWVWLFLCLFFCASHFVCILLKKPGTEEYGRNCGA